MVINIPEDLYSQLQDLALMTAQPLDKVVADRLRSTFVVPPPRLSPDEEAELAALRHLSNDTLRTLAAEQMPRLLQDRLSLLMEKNSRGTISEAEYQELETLVERGQQLMLRKAEAGVILLERGQSFTQADFKPHE